MHAAATHKAGGSIDTSLIFTVRGFDTSTKAGYFTILIFGRFKDAT